MHDLRTRSDNVSGKVLASNRGRFLFVLAFLAVCVGLGLIAEKSLVKDHRLAAVTPVWPKVSHLRDGGTIAVSRGGVVTQRDRRGALVAVSYFEYCGAYSRWVKFMSSLQEAVQTGNRGRIAGMAGYPLTWDHGREKTKISDRKSLLANYASIFNPSVVAAITHADPLALFCHEFGVMLGDGVAWGEESGNSLATGRLVLVTINSGSS